MPRCLGDLGDWETCWLQTFWVNLMCSPNSLLSLTVQTSSLLMVSELQYLQYGDISDIIPSPPSATVQWPCPVNTVTGDGCRYPPGEAWSGPFFRENQTVWAQVTPPLAAATALAPWVRAGATSATTPVTGAEVEL